MLEKKFSEAGTGLTLTQGPYTWAMFSVRTLSGAPGRKSETQIGRARKLTFGLPLVFDRQLEKKKKLTRKFRKTSCYETSSFKKLQA